VMHIGGDALHDFVANFCWHDSRFRCEFRIEFVNLHLLPLDGAATQARVFVRNEAATEVTLAGTLHQADDVWDLPALASEAVARVTFAVPAGHDGPVTAALSPLPRGLYWLLLAAADGVTWLQQSWAPPGITSAHQEEGRWVFAPGQFTRWQPLAADALPATRAFEPANVTNGVARPEQWPNVWLSDGPAPQWLHLDLPAPAAVRLIQIAWGLDFHRSFFQMGACFRAPECACDYRIVAVDAAGREHVWAQVQGNFQRLCRHPRPEGAAAEVVALRIEVAATHGAPRVEMDEVRVYA